jgi:hypothetical protein
MDMVLWVNSFPVKPNQLETQDRKLLPKINSIFAGERLNLDISSIKGESYGGYKRWVLVVDD